MHLLFIHRAFPAQFGRLALELTRRYGWKCSFLVSHLSRCPTPSPEMLERLELHRIPLPNGGRAEQDLHWAEQFGRDLKTAEAIFESVRARPGLRPDLVVSHNALAPAVFLPEILDCPVVNYCEYYFAPRRRDLTYRADLPPAEPAPFYPRAINATTLLGLAECAGGYAPTEWQRRSFPERFRHKIEVHFDGLDTELYRPRQVPRTVAGKQVPPDVRIVTFVARGLESMRGFDLFLRVANRVARARTDVLFVVVGEDKSFYGWDRLQTGGPSFKEWALARHGYDPVRFLFIENLEPHQLADLLCLSDLHLYLTVPFVLSWSLFNALACGCVVLAADVEPVREVIEPGIHGLVEPLFDTDRLAETALRVLADPDAFRPLGRAGRRLMENRYSLEIAVPELKGFFERVASREPLTQAGTAPATWIPPSAGP